jgi:hypothetical protein
MGIELKLLDSQRMVRSKVVKAFVYELNKRSNTIRLRSRLKYGVKTIIANAIMGEPEYQSLLGGRLYGEFGIPEASQKVHSLILHWMNEFTVQVYSWRAIGPRIVGGFTVNAVRADFSKVLGMPEAQQMTEKGQVLPWLDWLLTEGDKIIIKDHYYARNALFEPYSRTGRGIMISEDSGFQHSGWKKGLVSGGWRVPPEFSGTINNNWITRALVGRGRSQGVRPQIRKLFKQVIKER